jgi:hypothetical protein
MKGPQKEHKKKEKNESREQNRERYFKIIDPETGESYGRYTGDTPKQAASKGYTKLLQRFRMKGRVPPKKSIIYLRESTRGSPKKLYGYSAMRQKLSEPQKLEIVDKKTGNHKVIVYRFRNKIKKVPVPKDMLVQKAGGVKTDRKKMVHSKKHSKKHPKKETKKETHAEVEK